MDKEIWKPVVGYEGIYEISSLGRVRGVDRYYTNSMGTKVFVPGQPIAVNIMKRTGYPHVSLNKEGRRKGRRSKVVDGYHVINGMRFKIVENKSLEKYYNINK